MQRTNASTTSSGKAGVLDDVLAAQQHELRRLGRDLLERAQPVEGIFVQETQAGINGRAAPGFQAVEAHLVQNRAAGSICEVVMRVAAMD